ncbi:hypothetical protein Aspvir_010198 [Aspergillus viridinutans]|uniref:Uncharacterized protein n=1 Tax=Aspergillus viridinutans TaxID=75553 RepID=A0A9P3BZU0_ASPVI|nr:uncharacterized protein Aspvir_010198 [Aspergillus viridinutans]GIK06080.1 hypothetical protein Aspvir_010198 [Aspergillus viridinutans]
MPSLAQLETQTRELLAAIKVLASHCQTAEGSIEATAHGVSPFTALGGMGDTKRARESVLESLTKLQVMVAGPTDVLQHMACQAQLLACLRWLAEFQVPACIPLDGSASIKDIAELVGVPETHICRIVRMSMTAGFLREPQPGYMAHSALSAAFVTNPSYFDAMMFLARIATPAALNMPLVTRQRSADLGERTAQNELGNTPASLAHLLDPSETVPPRLERQWHAYLRFGTGNVSDTATDILSCLEPLQAANASVVEVGARSTDRAVALANQYPTLRFTVQIHFPSAASGGKSRAKYDKTRSRSSNPHITVQYRNPGTPQHIQDAAIYIINFPLPIPGVLSSSITARIETELRAHLHALRMSQSATLVLTAPALPEQGTMSTEVAVLTRIRDLSFLQLADEREPEISELINLVNGVGDSEGKFVVVNKVKSVASNGAIALEVKYQAYADR